MSYRTLEPNDKYAFRAELTSSRSGSKYIVSRRSDNDKWECSCPQWKFRRIQCHHIEEVVAGEKSVMGIAGESRYTTIGSVEHLRITAHPVVNVNSTYRSRPRRTIPKKLNDDSVAARPSVTPESAHYISADNKRAITLRRKR